MLLLCEKSHYRARQGLMELSVLSLGCRGEYSEMSHFLPEACLKQGEASNVCNDVRKSNIHCSLTV